MKRNSGQVQPTSRTADPCRLGEDLLALTRAWLHGHRGWTTSTTDLPAFWVLTQRHGLGGMAGSFVAAGAVCPDYLRDRAFQTYCTNTLRFKQSIQVCHRIRNAAQSAGISLSFVKGPALVPAYGDEGVRGFADIDVLVPSGNDARALARACGFEILHGATDVPSRFWLRAKGIGRVEVGTGQFGVEFTFGSLPANEPLHELCQRWPDRFLLPTNAGDPFPVPSPEAHLLFLLQHLAQHWCDRLIWRVDLAILMRAGNFDADWLEYAADRLEMRKLLRGVTGFCRRHLDEAVPELGRGPVGWKDGLFLSLLAPEALVGAGLSKYRHERGGGVKDAFLGAFQHVFATDLEKPLWDRRRAAARWMGEWLQHVLFPGGSFTSKLGPLVTPIMFLAMTILVCTVFRRRPRGFAQLAGRSLSDGPHPLRSDNQHEANHLAA